MRDRSREEFAERQESLPPPHPDIVRERGSRVWEAPAEALPELRSRDSERGRAKPAHASRSEHPRKAGEKRSARHGEKSGDRSREPRPGSEPSRGRRDRGPRWEPAGPPVNVRARAALALEEILARRQSLKRVVQREQMQIPREEDRALLREMVAGVVRNLPAIDGVLERLVARGIEETEGFLVNILRVGAYQILHLSRIPNYAAVGECVEAAKMVRPGAAGFVNGILRTVAEKGAELQLRQLRDARGPALIALECGVPAWLAERYAARFGVERARAILEAYQKPASPGFLVPVASREVEALDSLREEGVRVEADPVLPRTYRAVSGNPLASKAFKSGLLYMMDAASQVPALLLPVSEGVRVLDLCAAPGGKTAVLAGRPGVTGVVSVDLEPRRLASMRENMRRMGLSGIELVRADIERGLPFTDAFGAVLLDAPCSSLGTLRKNPEIRWQIRAEEFAGKARRQRSLLQAAASTVAPGGYLLYAVCSLEPEETAEVADAFLASRPEFHPAALRAGSALEPLLEAAGEGRAYLLPDIYHWDGFFVALFQRQD